MWVCNLCGAAETWRVYALAGVHQAAHRINGDCSWGRDVSGEENTGGEASEEPGGGGVKVQTCKSAEKSRTVVRVGRRSVSVQDYSCRAASVCSSCGLWIRDVHHDVGWSRSVLFCVHPQRKRSNFYPRGKLNQPQTVTVFTTTRHSTTSTSHEHSRHLHLEKTESPQAGTWQPPCCFRPSL